MKIEKCMYCSSITLLAASEDVSATNTKAFPAYVYGSACSNMGFNDAPQAFGSYMNTCSRANSYVSI